MKRVGGRVDRFDIFKIRERRRGRKRESERREGRKGGRPNGKERKKEREKRGLIAIEGDDGMMGGGKIGRGGGTDGPSLDE